MQAFAIHPWFPKNEFGAPNGRVSLVGLCGSPNRYIRLCTRTVLIVLQNLKWQRLGAGNCETGQRRLYELKTKSINLSPPNSGQTDLNPVAIHESGEPRVSENVYGDRMCKIGLEFECRTF